jgi:TIR domain
MSAQQEAKIFAYDFFVSYNKADKDWATWIAWQLEEAERKVSIQAWDFRPGANFVLKMQEALATSKQTIMVLSEDYLNSSFTAPEWAAVFAADPMAKDLKLVPVRVRECKPQGLLATLIYVDLLGLSEDAATAALLGAFSRRAKPSAMPAFPGDRPNDTVLPAIFPGASNLDVHGSPLPTLDFTTPAASALLSARERLQLIAKLNEVVAAQFNILLFLLKPPDGLVPPMPAPQADRIMALLTWAESPLGSGLQMVKESLDDVSKSQPISPELGSKKDTQKSILPEEGLSLAESNRQSTSAFWTTMPGLLTGIAAILTAFVGAHAVFHHSAPRATIFVNPNTIRNGQSSTLTWQTTDATVVNIKEIGAVTTNGSQQVTPDSSIAYHLTAIGAGGTQEASAQISVVPSVNARDEPRIGATQNTCAVNLDATAWQVVVDETSRAPNTDFTEADISQEGCKIHTVYSSVNFGMEVDGTLDGDRTVRIIRTTRLDKKDTCPTLTLTGKLLLKDENRTLVFNLGPGDQDCKDRRPIASKVVLARK